MKYNKDSNRITNLLLHDTYQKGLPIRKVKNDFKLPDNSDTDEEFFDSKIYDEEQQKIINVIMNKEESQNIKININEK